MKSSVQNIGGVMIETHLDDALPESAVRIITGRNRDDVLLAAERLSAEARIASFGELEKNRATGEYRLIGATTGAIAKCYIGIAIGLAIYAIAMFFITPADARPKNSRTCDSYSWCLDWKKNPFFRRENARRSK